MSETELEALHNRGVGLMGQFNYADAASIFERLVDAVPRSADFKVDLAIALLNRRQDDDLARAAALLDEVIRTEPDNLRALYCRALLDFHDGRPGAARRMFEQVARADPDDGYAAYYVGQCLFAEGEFEGALQQYQRAQQIDPYLRSAPYGGFQSAQRLGDREKSTQYLDTFQRLADNPRARLAELKYSRMGPKAEVVARGASSIAGSRPRPTGPVFRPPAPLDVAGAEAVAWRTVAAAGPLPSVTVADLDGDRQWDLFIAAAFEAGDSPLRNAVLLQHEEGFALDADHPLATVDSVRAALWGDFDDDQLVDVYLCRDGANQLWRQTEPGTWADVTVAAGVAGGELRTVDGACYDADHDGDLDYFLVNADGPNELLSNNRDGSFTRIAADLGIAGSGAGSRQVVLADLDSDDDADLVVLNNRPPHEVYVNDRLWEYRPGTGFDELQNTPLKAAVAADTDVDGQIELITLGPQGVSQWTPDDAQTWKAATIATTDDNPELARAAAMALCDFNGNGKPQVLTSGRGQWTLLNLDGTMAESARDEQLSGILGVLVGASGPEVVACRSEAAPLIWRAGAGRFPFVQVQLVGRTDKGQEMRSNASGIGVRGAARIDNRWVAIPASRQDSGPGQSLQPISIGLGGAEKIDFIRLLWPEGVSQSELDVAPGQLRVIDETQRQAGSCPLVFVWNGRRFQFVADVLGAGGIGFNLGKGEYYDPRPEENLLLPPGLIQPRDGRLAVKLGEPMEEICYFDAVRLVAYDVPPGWQMTLDERFGGLPPLPTGKPRFFRRELLPTVAVNDRGEDVTDLVAARDRRAAPLHRSDRRFVGLTNPHAVTLTFDRPLDQLTAPVLVFDGWVEYAYSQTAFAAWQAGLIYQEPTVEARGSDGQWHVVAERFGYMAGTPRQASVPLPCEQLPIGTRQLRIHTNMQIYWDRLAVIDVEENPNVRRRDLPLQVARVDDVGFSTRTLYDQRYPVYDYDRRPPLGDTRHPAGFYTDFGDALELVAATDDALAIIGPGEELHLEYAAPQDDLPAGWTRYFILESDGWCKDADLFTKGAGTVEPLPRRNADPSPAETARREALHGKYNTRYRDGW